MGGLTGWGRLLGHALLLAGLAASMWALSGLAANLRRLAPGTDRQTGLTAGLYLAVLALGMFGSSLVVYWQARARGKLRRRLRLYEWLLGDEHKGE